MSAPERESATPQEQGWAAWESGRCSITRCPNEPVAAIQRVARVRRPAHWQAYCEQHARARGVERQGSALMFTAEFLNGSGAGQLERR